MNLKGGLHKANWEWPRIHVKEGDRGVATFDTLPLACEVVARCNKVMLISEAPHCNAKLRCQSALDLQAPTFPVTALCEFHLLSISVTELAFIENLANLSPPVLRRKCPQFDHCLGSTKQLEIAKRTMKINFFPL